MRTRRTRQFLALFYLEHRKLQMIFLSSLGIKHFFLVSLQEIAHFILSQGVHVLIDVCVLQVNLLHLLQSLCVVAYQHLHKSLQLVDGLKQPKQVHVLARKIEAS